jgi:hypothetical protein
MGGQASRIAGRVLLPPHYRYFFQSLTFPSFFPFYPWILYSSFFLFKNTLFNLYPTFHNGLPCWTWWWLFQLWVLFLKSVRQKRSWHWSIQTRPVWNTSCLPWKACAAYMFLLCYSNFDCPSLCLCRSEAHLQVNFFTNSTLFYRRRGCSPGNYNPSREFLRRIFISTLNPSSQQYSNLSRI